MKELEEENLNEVEELVELTEEEENEVEGGSTHSEKYTSVTINRKTDTAKYVDCDDKPQSIISSQYNTAIFDVWLDSAKGGFTIHLKANKDVGRGYNRNINIVYKNKEGKTKYLNIRVSVV